jgi:hypothetical protein
LLKFACTDALFVIDTLQVGEVPEHAPPQLRKRRPAGGVAVSVTVVPCANLAEQVFPQLIPASDADVAGRGHDAGLACARACAGPRAEDAAARGLGFQRDDGSCRHGAGTRRRPTAQPPAPSGETIHV